MMKRGCAIVTGAATGIGLEICKRLASEGNNVILNDIDEIKSDRAARCIKDLGGSCESFPGDASSLNFLERMVEYVFDKYKHIDFLVANAGLTLFGDFFNYTESSFDKVVNLNLKGTFFLIQMVVNKMKIQNNGGSIVLMSSVTGHQAHRNLAVYGMTKAALEMLAKSLVLPLSPLRIRINTIAPGATITERTLKDDAAYKEKWSKITPMRRAAYPKDIANAVLFLLSENASHITGQNLIIDGGWTVISPQPD